MKKKKAVTQKPESVVEFTLYRSNQNIWQCPIGNYSICVTYRRRLWAAAIKKDGQAVRIGTWILDINSNIDQYDAVERLLKIPQIWYSFHWYSVFDHFKVVRFRFLDQTAPKQTAWAIGPERNNHHVLVESYDYGDSLYQALLEETLHRRKPSPVRQTIIKQSHITHRAEQIDVRASKENYDQRPLSGYCRHGINLEQCPRCASWGSDYDVRWDD